MIPNKTNLSTILLLFISCLAFIFPAQAQDKEPEILVSSKIIQDSNTSYINKLENGTLELGNRTQFNVQARLSPATEEKEVLFEQTELKPRTESIRCKNASCSQEYRFDLAARDISIMDRPKLEIAWKQSRYGKTPRMDVDATFTSGNNTRSNRTEKVAGIFQGIYKAEIEKYKSLDIKNATFIKKSKWYLAKRELGLSSDSRWRYSRNGENLVLQRRVDVPLSNATAIRIVAHKDYVPEKVNFSIDKDGNGLRDAYVLDGQTEKDVKITDDLAIITINLKNALQKKGIDPGRAILMEPILFLPLKYGQFKQLAPLKRITLGRIKQEQRKSDQVREGIRPKVQHRQDYVSLVFDFSQKLNQMGMWDASYKDLEFQIEAGSPQQIRWRQLRLFSSFNDQVPKILLQPGKRLKQWGIDKLQTERFERVASFEPVLKSDISLSSNSQKMSDLFVGNYKGNFLSITGANHLFSVEEKNGSVRIYGFPQGKQSKSLIKIPPQKRDMILGFTSNCMRDITLKSLGGNTYNAPLKQFLKNGRFQLPKETKAVLQVGQYVNATNRDSFNSTNTTSWFLEIHKKPANNAQEFDFRAGENAEVQLKTSNNIQDALAYHSQGLHSLTALLTYKREGNTKQEVVHIEGDAGYLDCLKKGDEILDWQPLYWSRYPASSVEPRIILFNVTHSKQFSLSDASSQWTAPDKLLTLNPENGKRLDSANTTYIYPPKELNYRLESEDIFSIDGIFFDNVPPSECTLNILQNQRSFNAAAGDGKSTFVQILYPEHNIELQIECSDKEALYKIPRPKVDCFGYKQSIQDYLKEVTIRIGDNSYPVNADLKDINQASWCNATSVTLGKGQHDISVTGNEFFHVDSVLLKTDSKIYSLNELKDDKSQSSGILQKLISLAKKLALLIVMIVLIYLFRKPIKSYLGRFWHLFSHYFQKVYWLFPEKLWLVLWLALAFALYGMGLLAQADQGGTAVSFAGLCVLVAFWHFMRLNEIRMKKLFPKISEHIYYSNSKIFFAGAIFLLLCTATFVALGLEPIAEQIAVIVYYQLVAGVILELVNLKKEEQQDRTSEPEHT